MHVYIYTYIHIYIYTKKKKKRLERTGLEHATCYLLGHRDQHTFHIFDVPDICTSVIKI